MCGRRTPVVVTRDTGRTRTFYYALVNSRDPIAFLFQQPEQAVLTSEMGRADRDESIACLNLCPHSFYHDGIAPGEQPFQQVVVGRRPLRPGLIYQGHEYRQITVAVGLQH